MADDGLARIAAVDAVRGVAVVLMIAYHGTWDATFLGLINLPLLTAWPWLVARATVLMLFLGLVGVSLTLGHDEGFRPRPFLYRLAQVGIGAALISAGTAAVFADEYVFFGALHHIAVASVLALPLLRLPSPVLVATSVIAGALPSIVTGGVFDRMPLAVLGLAATPPASVDFVPLLPWFAAVPAGMLLGRVIARSRHRPWLAWRPEDSLARLLVMAGRHSLIVYLVHQLPLMGGLWLISRLTQ